MKSPFKPGLVWIPKNGSRRDFVSSTSGKTTLMSKFSPLSFRTFVVGGLMSCEAGANIAYASDMVNAAGRFFPLFGHHAKNSICDNGVPVNQLASGVEERVEALMKNSGVTLLERQGGSNAFLESVWSSDSVVTAKAERLLAAAEANAETPVPACDVYGVFAVNSGDTACLESAKGRVERIGYVFGASLASKTVMGQDGVETVLGLRLDFVLADANVLRPGRRFPHIAFIESEGVRSFIQNGACRKWNEYKIEKRAAVNQAAVKDAAVWLEKHSCLHTFWTVLQAGFPSLSDRFDTLENADWDDTAFALYHFMANAAKAGRSEFGHYMTFAYNSKSPRHRAIAALYALGVHPLGKDSDDRGYSAGMLTGEPNGPLLGEFGDKMIRSLVAVAKPAFDLSGKEELRSYSDALIQAVVAGGSAAIGVRPQSTVAVETYVILKQELTDFLGYMDKVADVRKIKLSDSFDLPALVDVENKFYFKGLKFGVPFSLVDFVFGWGGDYHLESASSLFLSVPGAASKGGTSVMSFVEQVKQLKEVGSYSLVETLPGDEQMQMSYSGISNGGVGFVLTPLNPAVITGSFADSLGKEQKNEVGAVALDWFLTKTGRATSRDIELSFITANHGVDRVVTGAAMKSGDSISALFSNAFVKRGANWVPIGYELALRWEDQGSSVANTADVANHLFHAEVAESGAGQFLSQKLLEAVGSLKDWFEDKNGILDAAAGAQFRQRVEGMAASWDAVGNRAPCFVPVRRCYVVGYGNAGMLGVIYALDLGDCGIYFSGAGEALGCFISLNRSSTAFQKATEALATPLCHPNERSVNNANDRKFPLIKFKQQQASMNDRRAFSPFDPGRPFDTTDVANSRFDEAVDSAATGSWRVSDCRSKLLRKPSRVEFSFLKTEFVDEPLLKLSGSTLNMVLLNAGASPAARAIEHSALSALEVKDGVFVMVSGASSAPTSINRSSGEPERAQGEAQNGDEAQSAPASDNSSESDGDGEIGVDAYGTGSPSGGPVYKADDLGLSFEQE